MQLGTTLTRTGCSWPGAEARIRAAQRALWADNEYRAKNLTQAERLSIYFCNIQLIMAYGNEAWAMNTSIAKILHQAEGGMLRRAAQIARKGNK